MPFPYNPNPPQWLSWYLWQKPVNQGFAIFFALICFAMA